MSPPQFPEPDKEPADPFPESLKVPEGPEVNVVILFVWPSESLKLPVDNVDAALKLITKKDEKI